SGGTNSAKSPVVQGDSPPPVDELPPGAANLGKTTPVPNNDSQTPRPADQTQARPDAKDNTLSGGKDNLLPGDDLNADDQVPEAKDSQSGPKDKSPPLVITLPVPPN